MHDKSMRTPHDKSTRIHVLTPHDKSMRIHVPGVGIGCGMPLSTFKPLKTTASLKTTAPLKISLRRAHKMRRAIVLRWSRASLCGFVREGVRKRGFSSSVREGVLQ